MKRSNRLSIKTSFQFIQGVILLLLVVLVFQSIVFWRACQRGSQATNGLEQEGLPSLRLLASLQENLAVYRLHSFEIMFAQDKDRPAKLAETDAVQQRNADIMGQLKQLYPDGGRPSARRGPDREPGWLCCRPWAASGRPWTRILPAR